MKKLFVAACALTMLSFVSCDNDTFLEEMCVKKEKVNTEETSDAIKSAERLLAELNNHPYYGEYYVE